MIATYNPFELLNLPMLKLIIRQGNNYIVLQRFNWPGIKEKKAFIGAPYREEVKAKEHQRKLPENEGKVLSLHLEIEKLTRLITTSDYYFFLSEFRDQQWHSRIEKRYQLNIATFLRTRLSIQPGDDFNVFFQLRFGQLKAAVNKNGVDHEFDAYEMIR